MIAAAVVSAVAVALAAVVVVGARFAAYGSV